MRLGFGDVKRRNHENSSRLFGLRISFEMPQIQENRSLNEETLHVVIHHFVMHLIFHNKALRNLRILEFRGINMNENSQSFRKGRFLNQHA